MSARYAIAVCEQLYDIDLFWTGAAKGFQSEYPNSPSCTHIARCTSPRQEGVKPVNVSFDFINQVLLDKRLSVASFKLWYFLKERADAEGKSFHGHRSISAITGIRKQSLKRYISELVEAGYLKVEHRPDTSDLYTIVSGCKTHPGWVQNAPAEVGAKCTLSTLNLSSTLNLEQPPISPLQGKSNMKTQGSLFPNHSFQENMVLKIYEAYPRKIKKPPWHKLQALKAIKEALREIKPEKLLELTEAYAQVRSTEDEQFTPFPAKWFREKRFNDDPEDWKDQFGKASKEKPKRTYVDTFNIEKWERQQEKIRKWCDEAPEAIHENH